MGVFFKEIFYNFARWLFRKFYRDTLFKNCHLARGYPFQDGWIVTHLRVVHFEIIVIYLGLPLGGLPLGGLPLGGLPLGGLPLGGLPLGGLPLGGLPLGGLLGEIIPPKGVPPSVFF